MVATGKKRTDRLSKEVAKSYFMKSIGATSQSGKFDLFSSIAAFGKMENGRNFMDIYNAALDIRSEKTETD